VCRRGQIGRERVDRFELEHQSELVVLRHLLLIPGQAVPDAAADAKPRDSGDARGRFSQRVERSPPILDAQRLPRLQQDDVRDHSSSFFLGGRPGCRSGRWFVSRRSR